MIGFCPFDNITIPCFCNTCISVFINISDASSISKLPGCVALGLFDGLHLGHLRVIEDMLRLASEKSLAPTIFTFDLSRGFPCGKAGSGRLLSDEGAREILSRMGARQLFRPAFEDFRDMPPRDFVLFLKERLRAKQLVCGGDFRFGKDAAGTTDFLGKICREIGMELHVSQAVLIGDKPVSSSMIRGLVSSGMIPQANSLLGREFFIDFEVTSGKKLGRKLGFPTINQHFPPDFTLPRFGVYATIAVVDGTLFPGVTNVGITPTVSEDAQVLAETHIQNFSGDLYGKRVKVRFLRFIRPEKKFPDIASLNAQIAQDVYTTYNIVEKYVSDQSAIT